MFQAKQTLILHVLLHCAIKKKEFVLINKIINFAIQFQHHINATLTPRAYTQRTPQQNLPESSTSAHLLNGSKPNSPNRTH